MAEPVRVRPVEAREKTTTGRALLVCAYDDEQKCKQMNLQGSITLNDLKSRQDSIPKDREIIFYCG
jgi:rhodanese-related sulfurtransferase